MAGRDRPIVYDEARSPLSGRQGLHYEGWHRGSGAIVELGGESVAGMKATGRVHVRNAESGGLVELTAQPYAVFRPDASLSMSAERKRS